MSGEEIPLYSNSEYFSGPQKEMGPFLSYSGRF
jgi:hypothetical protein